MAEVLPVRSVTPDTRFRPFESLKQFDDKAVGITIQEARLRGAAGIDLVKAPINFFDINGEIAAVADLEYELSSEEDIDLKIGEPSADDVGVCFPYGPPKLVFRLGPEGFLPVETPLALELRFTPASIDEYRWLQQYQLRVHTPKGIFRLNCEGSNLDDEGDEETLEEELEDGIPNIVYDASMQDAEGRLVYVPIPMDADILRVIDVDFKLNEDDDFNQGDLRPVPYNPKKVPVPA